MTTSTRLVHGLAAVALAFTTAVVGGNSAVSAETEPAGSASAAAPLRASEGLGYTPLNPVRLLDTREGVGAPSGKLGPNEKLTLRTVGQAGVPTTGVDSVVLNVTVVGPTAPVSFLTVWPSGGVRPEASSLNFVEGQTVPNLVISKVGEFGRVDIYNSSGEAHVLADIVGYYADTSDFTGLTPARALDTRRGIGAPAAQVGPGESIDLQVTGQLGVPTDGVGAVVMNVTATKADQGSFVTVWPTGGAQPDASNVNFGAGQSVPNLVIVKVGSGGKVSLANEFGNVDLLADVVGYFIDGASYVGVAPTRILNTRDGVGAPVGKVGAGERLALEVLGRGGVPALDVRAVVLNMTAAAPTSRSFITVWPGGDIKPTASSLNMVAGRNVANLVIAKVGLDGTVWIENNAGSTHVIADVVGYIDAAAGPDLPALLDVPASNEWSAVNFAVTSAVLREQDRTSGSFAEDQYDTPFILDLEVTVRNNTGKFQSFADELFAVTAGSEELPLIDVSTSLVAVLGGAVVEFGMSFAVGWADDLDGLALELGGVDYEPGSVNLVGAQIPPLSVDAGASISGTSIDGVCTTGGQEVDFVALSTTWRESLSSSIDVTGINPAVYQAPSGMRWLEIELSLDGSNCSSANVNTGEFELTVDGSFVAAHGFINEILGTLLARPRSEVTAAFLVPLDAEQVEFSVVGAPGSFNVPTTNLR